jgi:hypothetical protein
MSDLQRIGEAFCDLAGIEKSKPLILPSTREFAELVKEDLMDYATFIMENGNEYGYIFYRKIPGGKHISVLVYRGLLSQLEVYWMSYPEARNYWLKVQSKDPKITVTRV